MTNLEKIVKSIDADNIPDILVLVARSTLCAFPAKNDCYDCPLFNLCMLEEEPEAVIKKWLESEVKDDA